MISDKVEGGYLPAYQKIAADLGPAARVLELGVYQGASLELWRGLFPEGEITGVDNQRHVGLETHGLETHKCRFILAGQADPDLPGLVGGPFDLIVDDCSHQGVLTRASFRLLWPLLAAGGYYVVEDWMIGLPGFWRHWMYDPAMFEAVKGFVELLDRQDAEVDEVVYRFGLAIVHKRRRS